MADLGAAMLTNFFALSRNGKEHINQSINQSINPRFSKVAQVIQTTARSTRESEV